MLDGLLCILIKFVNLLFTVLFGWWIDMLIFILEMLPNSPFKFEPVKWGQFGNAIGYFIPIQRMLEHFGAILIAVTVWYAIQHTLRLLKMVR